MDLDLNLGKELGATGEPAAQRLTLYIPNKDRVDKEFADHERWVRADRLAANLTRLREFLHRFGSETNQGEVKFEFDGWIWTIAHWDAPAKG